MVVTPDTDSECPDSAYSVRTNAFLRKARQITNTKEVQEKCEFEKMYFY